MKSGREGEEVGVSERRVDAEGAGVGDCEVIGGATDCISGSSRGS